jgi:hypothetical protein
MAEKPTCAQCGNIAIGIQSLLGSHSSQDKERHDEEEHHPPMDHLYPHAAHHPQVKSPLPPPRHDAHSRSHGDELPDHTNAPSTIRPSKKMTKTGKS